MSHSASLEECIQICDFLASLIERSFGPNGESALLLTSTGQTIVTTSGIGILEAVHCSHPIAKIILQTVLKQCQHTGDGSKSFLLLLREILQKIKQVVHINKLSFIHKKPLQVWLANCFTEVLNVHLPQCFAELRNTTFTHKLKVETKNAENVGKFCSTLLQTFFFGRFSSLIAKILSSLVENFVFKSILDWTKFDIFLQQSILHFDVICTTIEGYSLEKSSVISGLVLQQNFTVVADSCFEGKQKFIIINPSCKDDYVNETIKIQDSSELCFTFEWDQKYYEKVFSMLQNHGITLILSTNSVPDVVLTFCYQYSISLVTMLSVEELDYIILNTRVQPLFSFTDMLSHQNIGIFDFIKLIQIEKQKYIIHGGLQESSSLMKVYHLLLHGPTKELCKQYFHECCNSLKVLYQWIALNDNCDERITCDNLLNSQNKFFTKTNNFETDISEQKEHSEFSEECKVLCICKKNEFTGLGSHGTENISKNNKIINKYYSRKCMHEFGNSSNDLKAYCIPAGGWWELSLHHHLTHRNFISEAHDIKLALGIVADSLISIPRTLHQNSQISNNSKFISIWKSMEKNLSQLDDGQFQSQNEHLWRYLEPVTIKETVIYYVVQLSIQLLRLNGIFGVGNMVLPETNSYD